MQQYNLTNTQAFSVEYQPRKCYRLSQLNIIKSTSEQEHTDTLANCLASLMCSTIEKKGVVTIALSGGKSPIPLFKRLSTLKLPWDKVTITLVDERVVDTNHIDSNENLVRTYLLKNLAKSAKFIGLINNNLTITPKIFHNIDIAVLGMGADGHTASIFPDCKELEVALDPNTQDTYIITTPISAKYQRVTLTLNSLKKIEHLILSINGTEKLKILQEAMKQENKNYPISYLIKERTDINVYYQE